MLPKHERLDVFIDRLRAAPRASSHDAALVLLSQILNATEDDLTDIPFNPAAWQNDGRMYPPQPDAARVQPNGVTRYRSRSHNTYISATGAVTIRATSGAILLEKADADGQRCPL